MVPPAVRTQLGPSGRTATVTLFCLPFAGGGASAYWSWPKLLPRADVRALQLPGRDHRIAEEPRLSFTEIADEIAPHTARPYAFYGHSMGARLGFEVIRELRRRGLPLPVAFLVGAALPPGHPVPLAASVDLPDEEFVEQLILRAGTQEELRDEPELRELLLPLFRADFTWLKEFQSPAEPPLPVPVIAFAGVEDPEVPPEKMAGWENLTSSGFRLHAMPGGHFFLRDSETTLIDLISEGLDELVPAAPARRMLHEAILEQAANTPDAVAVRQWDQELTYAGLTARAAALARVLRDAGAGPEVPVGICTRRTPNLIVATLAVMLSGSAYVPIDLSHPRKRIATVIDDARIGMVIADQAGRDLLEPLGTRLIDLPSPDREWPESTPPPNAVQPAGAAYILYTSGSTGVPKGVVVGHNNLMAFVEMAGEYLGIGPGSRSIGFAALGFDASVLDIYVPLTRGGSVELVPDEDRVDPVRLQRFLAAHEVTVGMLPPAVLPLLDPEQLPTVRCMTYAGEPAGPEQVARWSRPGHRSFINLYGPTETTVVVVGTELTGEWNRPLPIGHALPGCRAHVVNDRLEACAPGEPGELLIGGPQVTRGYLRRPALTSERFVADHLSGEPGARLYRTGDRVVIEEDGRIGFIGRIDRQVKVQGQRAEIGEIESVLRAHPKIEHAVVDIAEGAAGLKELVAYLAPADAPDITEVHRHCAERLPPYMIPHHVHRSAVLPLNVAGKVDMSRLRREAQAGAVSEKRGGAPETPAERAVAAAWAEVFESAEPALDDDFFFAGGHSLVAMRLVTGIRARLAREVTVRDVIEGRTVAEIARRAGNASAAEARGVVTAGRSVLSSIQHRMWFVELLVPGTPAHNIAMAQRIHGPLDVGALSSALEAVARHHEVLRWRLPQSGGVPHVVVEPPDAQAGVTLDPEPVGEDELGERLQAEARITFDLEKGPIWRARLLRLAPDDHVLAVTVHHVAFDGWSQHVYFRDLAAALRGEPMSDSGSSFSGYVAALEERKERNAGDDLEWWAGRLAGAPPVVELPGDHDRPPVQTFDGAAVHAEIGPSTHRAVRDLAHELGVTPYAVMLTAFALTVRRLIGRDDLIVGAPVADRAEAAFADIIGCLVQVLPMRFRPDDEASFTAAVRDCQAELAAALAHPDVPLDGLVDRLGVPRDLSRNPLIQVLFNMYSYAEPRFDAPGLEARPLPPGLPGALFDLTLYVGEEDDRYLMQAVYNPGLMRAGRVEALVAGYVRLLEALLAAPGDPVRLAPMRPLDSALPYGERTPETPMPAGLVERIQERGRERPGALAITGTGGDLTYDRLVALAGAVTSGVRDAKVEPGETVAVLATRSAELPAVLLGVLATGARWAILDPALPPERIEAQARAADARAVLVCDGAAGTLPGIPVVSVPSSGGPAAPHPAVERGYMAFTSGTTGRPQAVRADERPLARFLEWYPEAYGLTDQDRFALLAGLAHDPLLRDAFTPLVLGGTLHVPPQELILDGPRLAEWLRHHDITVLHLTPQLAILLAAAQARLPALRLAVFAGDQLTGSVAAGFRDVAPEARLINAYGTTETPQVQSAYEVPAELARPGPVPVGRGIDGAELLILADGRPAAIGELGEVVIRSDRLADGYADPQLTKERFGDRSYRTGDLGRYTPDGDVVLAGRSDGQIKVRGYRVELGEIESVAIEHPGVRSAAAAVNGAGAPVLYAVPNGTGTRAADLRGHLKTRLPEYALPADVVLLPRLPLTPNGKIDTAALPSAASRPSGGGDELKTAAERLVAGVWREVLGVPRIGAEDNFFEIGGHSLAMAEVQARLTGQLEREIPVVDLFRHASVRALAAHLDAGAQDQNPERRRIAARRARAGRAGRAARTARRGTHRDQDGDR